MGRLGCSCEYHGNTLIFYRRIWSPRIEYRDSCIRRTHTDHLFATFSRIRCGILTLFRRYDRDSHIPCTSQIPLGKDTISSIYFSIYFCLYRCFSRKPSYLDISLRNDSCWIYCDQYSDSCSSWLDSLHIDYLRTNFLYISSSWLLFLIYHLYSDKIYHHAQ